MTSVQSYLSGGDFRMNKKSKPLIAKALKQPQLVKALVAAMVGGDPLVRMRAADVLESVSAQRPSLLHRFKRIILTKAAPITQQEVRWHVAQLIPRLKFSTAEKRWAFATLLAWANDVKQKSNIVRVFSLQGAFDLARGSRALEHRVLPTVKRFAASAIPSQRSRGKRLLLQLKNGYKK